MTLVKICGVRNSEAAITAIEAGADFLGFNFVPTSKRLVNSEMAREIADQVRGKVQMVGIFQNAEIDLVNQIASFLNLDFVQLHGVEDNDYFTQVKFPVIKSIKIDEDPHNIEAKYLLLDREEQGKGETVDAQKAAEFAKSFPIFLAGGLNPENVAEAIADVQPFAVDVAGGIEIDGVQDLEKIRLFVKNAKGDL